MEQIINRYRECSKSVPQGFALFPSFDPENPILEVADKGNKVFVVIDRISKTPRAKLRYTMLKTQNAYRVSDQVKIFDEMKNKFVSFDILL